ncbi:hypothetical protein RF55_12593 [Lasius niger]|uniref:Uncharacterized protein n=1 Tax=Lasius niger TaxID=67767 RepID=A0A0J7KCM7_LASNI|nr:hypothetical protein RF55_12593 [Lasius niger]
MGDLPYKRVQQYRLFLYAGVNFAGPTATTFKGPRYQILQGLHRGLCLLLNPRSTPGDSSGYTAEDFLNVYRRFVARRGICATLSSACGTNFVGADKELRCLLEQAKAESPEIAQILVNDGTKWRFNPPSAPHFGRIWEAAVKSVKFHLKWIIGDTLLTFEEMTTLLSQIEACLNSRSLQSLTDDPTDLEVLTPAHFLIGSPTLTEVEFGTERIYLKIMKYMRLYRSLCTKCASTIILGYQLFERSRAR